MIFFRVKWGKCVQHVVNLGFLKWGRGWSIIISLNSIILYTVMKVIQLWPFSSQKLFFREITTVLVLKIEKNFQKSHHDAGILMLFNILYSWLKSIKKWTLNHQFFFFHEKILRLHSNQINFRISIVVHYAAEKICWTFLDYFALLFFLSIWMCKAFGPKYVYNVFETQFGHIFLWKLKFLTKTKKILIHTK